jgi:hypothetical protein
MSRVALLGVLAAGLAVTLAPEMAQAATIGWLDPVQSITDEGMSVGQVITALAILSVGPVMVFGLNNVTGTIASVCICGALMANAGLIRDTLFPAAGAGGGSIHDLAIIQQVDPATLG